MAPPVFALQYMTRFRCIADRCEDTCCAGLQIPLSASDEQRLARALGDTPQGRAELAAHLQVLPEPVHGCSSVLARTEDAACRFLDAERLCSLVVRAGDDALPDPCALFPRVVAWAPERAELSGSLACPEAARLCLLSDDGAELVPAAPELLSRSAAPTFIAEPESYDALSSQVRDVAVSLLRTRAWPMRTRLMQLATLGARTEAFFFRGASGPGLSSRLALELGYAQTDEAWRETHAALEGAQPRGELVVQLLFSILAGLRERGTKRFQALLGTVTYAYQTAVLALEPSLGQAPQPSLLWSALWRALIEKQARARSVFGARLELLLERYWVNDLYRAPFTRAPSLSAHVFQMILRGAVLRFLVLGHPVIVELAARSTLAGEDVETFDAAFIEAVQLYAKHIERDADMFVMLERHFTLESLRTDALGRARLFAAAA